MRKNQVGFTISSHEAISAIFREITAVFQLMLLYTPTIPVDSKIPYKIKRNTLFQQKRIRSDCIPPIRSGLASKNVMHNLNKTEILSHQVQIFALVHCSYTKH